MSKGTGTGVFMPRFAAEPGSPDTQKQSPSAQFAPQTAEPQARSPTTEQQTTSSLPSSSSSLRGSPLSNGRFASASGQSSTARPANSSRPAAHAAGPTRCSTFPGVGVTAGRLRAAAGPQGEQLGSPTSQGGDFVSSLGQLPQQQQQQGQQYAPPEAACNNNAASGWGANASASRRAHAAVGRSRTCSNITPFFVRHPAPDFGSGASALQAPPCAGRSGSFTYSSGSMSPFSSHPGQAAIQAAFPDASSSMLSRAGSLQASMGALSLTSPLDLHQQHWVDVNSGSTSDPGILIDLHSRLAATPTPTTSAQDQMTLDCLAHAASMDLQDVTSALKLDGGANCRLTASSMQQQQHLGAMHSQSLRTLEDLFANNLMANPSAGGARLAASASILPSGTSSASDTHLHHSGPMVLSCPLSAGYAGTHHAMDEDIAAAAAAMAQEKMAQIEQLKALQQQLREQVLVLLPLI